MALGPGVHDVSLAQSTGRGSHHQQLCGTWLALQGPRETANTVGSLAPPPGHAAKDQVRQCWWPELVVCTHLAEWASCRAPQQQGQIADTHVVVASSKNCDRLSTLVPAGALAVGVCYCGCWVLLWAHGCGGL